VSHLHSLQSDTFVTTITYYTLTSLHWLTSQLSITISNYHTLYIFTVPVSVSYRDLTRRTTPLEKWLVGLLLKNWLLRHSSSSYITLNRTSVTVACCPVRCQMRAVIRHSRKRGHAIFPYSSWVWRHRDILCSNARCGSARHARHGTARSKHRFPYCREAFSGRLPSNGLLRNPTMGWHVTIYIYIWYMLYIFIFFFFTGATTHSESRPPLWFCNNKFFRSKFRKPHAQPPNWRLRFVLSGMGGDTRNLRSHKHSMYSYAHNITLYHVLNMH
jgi:hypothetical protein